MRLLVRSAGGGILPILVLQLLLLQGLILIQFDSLATVDASRLHERWGSRDPEEELLRSLARYRQLLQNENDSRPDPVKPEEAEIISVGQEKDKETEKSADGAAENPEKDVDKLQPLQTVDELDRQQKDGEAEVINNEEPISEKTEEQNWNQETKGTDPISEKTEEQNWNQETKGTDLNVVNDEQMNEKKQSDQEEHVDTTGDPKLEGEKLDEGKEQQTEATNASEEPTVGKAERKDVESKFEENTSEEQTKSSESKTDEEKPVEEKPVEEPPFVFPEPYLLGPTIKDWDEQRADWLESNPHMKSESDGKPRVLIVTGSQPSPCQSPVGDYFHLKSIKLKIDYARIHNYEIFYNFAWLDPLFGGFWIKLPILRTLMLTHPEIEWFFWIDSDAIFTDMLFEAPFDTYDGINMVMWGYHHGFYVDRSWVAFNAGVFLIRNCQWSLDLIDKWSPMGPYGQVSIEYGKILTSFFSNRPENYAADDQSALAYLMLTDEAVNSKIKLVDLAEYMVSAWWKVVVGNYETSMEKYHPGLGDSRWPWITHFTGCGPCNADTTTPEYQQCMANMTRALNFADNQVLAYMGFQHESLSSDTLIPIRNESDRPIDLVGVNPWEERIAQLASMSAA